MPKKLTTEEFIDKSNQIHKGVYKYSKVVYVESKSKVIITCLKHGDFKQIPNVHLRGGGCIQCGRDRVSHKLRSNVQSFIEKATLIHGDVYDYSKVVYIKNNSNVVIVCREHGDFLQAPNTHLNNRGCPKCGKIKNWDSIRGTTEEFILKSKEIHGDKFDYSEVVYKNAHEKVIIGCPVHGKILQKPYKHISGNGCYKCSASYKSNTERFTKKASKIHRDKYDYSKVNYVKSNKKVTIVCPDHGDFLQKPSDHIQGGGCPKDNKSRGHIAVRFKLQDLKLNFIEEWKDPTCRHIKPLPFDFLIPDLKLLIEFDGEQHRKITYFYTKTKEEAVKNFKLTQKKDNIKNNWAKENGYILLRIESIAEVEEKLTSSLIEDIKNSLDGSL